MRAVRYALEQALVSLSRSGRSAAMSIGTIAIAFLTLGLFLLVSENLESVIQRWAAAAEMSVFLRDELDETTRGELMAELGAHRAVAAVEFVSKQDALARFKHDFPELGDLAESSENPFPPSIEVRLHTDPASTGAAEAMAQQMAERSGVADVRYDRQWLGRLMAIVGAIRLTGLAIAAVLVLGAAFTVAAVVRLSLQARQDELEIMQLVGAPFGYIRGPSVAEGTFLGGIGAALSLLALWALFSAMRGRLSETIAGLANGGEVRFLGMADATGLVVAGLVVGALAGVIASPVWSLIERSLNSLNDRLVCSSPFFGRFLFDTPATPFYTEASSTFPEGPLEPYAAIPDRSSRSVSRVTG
ncbi:MAG TPA: ABC transporter permease [Vicinamibacterales bacterium]|nr:ABC transporter permease [Vicinamibacterales bacterium]